MAAIQIIEEGAIPAWQETRRVMETFLAVSDKIHARNMIHEELRAHSLDKGAALAGY